MKNIIFSIFLLVCVVMVHAQNTVDRTIPFDAGWHFIKDSTIVANAPDYDDSKWRTVDLPHDWSIEDLPNQKQDTTVGPFSRSSIGKASTGFTVGGTGWYRKKFATPAASHGKLISIHFDGVYMNSEVWINDKLLGNHPNGYTPFSYDLTPYLKPAGQQNTIAVSVRNEGKNSRWYSGSGIYRHVSLNVTERLHIANWGVFVTTPDASESMANIRVRSTINNDQSAGNGISLVTTIISPDGKIVGSTQKTLKIGANASEIDSQNIAVANPGLWSLESPKLYKVVTEIRTGNKTIDRLETPFGIRSIHFDAMNGFTLNGELVVLKGGCIHHDNGPLGAAAIDRAEERKIELLKKVGYNAIRTSHQPPSKALLEACDRLGMLVLDEAFDMWELAKNQQDYHLYFKEWWQKDLQSMVLRDRNHPSVIMWSIGNEIYEAPDSTGHQLSKKLADEVRRLDPTRPVTAAMVYLPPYTKKPWQDYETSLANLDVDGYNYFLETKDIFFQRDSATANRFDSEHAKHPGKTFIVTEYLPTAALENWEKSVTAPYVMGSFKWTAMDYIGEAGIGRSLIVAQSKKMPKGLMGMGMFYRDTWPVYNAFCGDLDLIGNRKASSYFQSVIWHASSIEMLVHRPLPDSMKEAIAPWGFPDEMKSWSWPGQEGKKVQVHVYTRSRKVRLELNGKLIGEQTVPDTSITATFELEYRPGILVAKSFDGEKQTGADTLQSVGKPFAIRLVADRKNIRADRNDLCYVSAEIIDENGNLVPYVNDLEITYGLTGSATIAGVGNGSVDDMSSFQQNHKKVYQGRGLAIVRPYGVPGKITLKANAKGLKEGSIQIIAK